MGRIRRGGHVFVTWIGDHTPRHVHVFRDGTLVLKWDLEAWSSTYGNPSRTLRRVLSELREEGLL